MTHTHTHTLTHTHTHTDTHARARARAIYQIINLSVFLLPTSLSLSLYVKYMCTYIHNMYVYILIKIY